MAAVLWAMMMRLMVQAVAVMATWMRGTAWRNRQRQRQGVRAVATVGRRLIGAAVGRHDWYGYGFVWGDGTFEIGERGVFGRDA